MKIWRDFKLLALCAGLLAMDGCKPEEEETLCSSCCTVTGRVVGVEVCQGYHYLVVAGLERQECSSEEQLIKGPRLVAGRYGGRDYQRLIRFRTEILPSGPLPHQELGACVLLWTNQHVPRPSCTADGLETLLLVNAVTGSSAICGSIPDPR
jgi:hypothetical protein